MVLEEATTYNFIDNSANNRSTELWFWDDMGICKGHLGCESQQPTALIMEIMSDYVFLTLCQICSYRATIGTIDWESLIFNGWTLLWLELNQIGAKMLNL